VNNEGYDAHDFNLFDDRSSVLWRKPYVDGAVRELTSGDTRSQEQMRQLIERMMLASGTTNPDVRYTTRKAHRSRANVVIDADVDDEQDLLTDMRRNREAYEYQVPSPPRTEHLHARGGGPEPWTCFLSLTKPHDGCRLDRIYVLFPVLFRPVLVPEVVIASLQVQGIFCMSRRRLAGSVQSWGKRRRLLGGIQSGKTHQKGGNHRVPYRALGVIYQLAGRRGRSNITSFRFFTEKRNLFTT